MSQAHKPVTVTLDEPSIAAINKLRRRNLASRSAIIRHAIEVALAGWRPIESAPEKCRFLAFDPEGFDIMSRSRDDRTRFVDARGVRRFPVGWMHLPDGDGVFCCVRLPEESR